MIPIRIVIAVGPLLGEIVEHSVAAEPDMEVVGAVSKIENVFTVAKDFDANVIILDDNKNAKIQTVMQLLNETPRSTVFVIAGDGRSAMQYTLKLHSSVIDNVSPDMLIQSIRAVAGKIGGNPNEDVAPRNNHP